MLFSFQVSARFEEEANGVNKKASQGGTVFCSLVFNNVMNVYFAWYSGMRLSDFFSCYSCY